MKRPIPFAWISCVGEKGGAETLMIECLRALDRSAFEPRVFQLRPGPLTQLLQGIDVPVEVLPAHRMREVHQVASAVWRVSRLAKRHRCAFLHSNGFRAHVYGGLAAQLARIPEVWTTHTVERPSWDTRAIMAIPTAKVLTNCPRTDDYFRGRGLPTTMAWAPINQEILRQGAAGASREFLSDLYRIPLDRTWLVTAGRLQYYKGQSHFLRAFAKLPARFNTHGVIVGGALFGQEEGYPAELRRLAKELGIAERITFAGFIPDSHVAGLFKASALMVHPALDEDFGLSVAEAQALGTPVAAFAAVGPAAIVLPGETGWLAPVGDVDALAGIIAEALENPSRLARLGEAAAPSAEARFGARRHAELTEAAYFEALGLPSPSSAGLNAQGAQG